MHEDHAPADELLAGRVPRTDWLLRRRRLVQLGTVAGFGVLCVIATLSPAWDERKFATAVAAWACFCAATAIVLAGAFAISRWARAARRREAGDSPESWRRHGYWSLGGEKRFVALQPSRGIATARRLLLMSAWFALAGGILLGVLQSPASCPTLTAAAVSLAVVMVLGMRGYANVGVEWRERPARTGANAHYVVSVAPLPRGRFERVEMTLRCVVETPRRRGLVEPAVACPYSATRLFADELLDGAVALHARFDVPPGLPAADPYGEPAVHWELVVSAERAGSRFDETFLVPVASPLS